MATFTTFNGRPDFDWEIILQDILENGALSPVGSSGNSLTMAFGSLKIVLAGSGLQATAARTIASGTVTGFSIFDGTTKVLTMAGLTSANASDMQNMISNAAGLDGYSEEFKAFIAPFFTDETVIGIGSNDGETILGSAGVDNISGLGGGDYIRGGNSVDVLAGGDNGDDQDYLDYRFDTRTIGVRLDLAANTVVNNDAAAAKVDTISGFEGGFGSKLDDIIRGTDGRNDLIGGEGNDILEGRGGGNWYHGSKGDDTIIGGTGTGDGQWDQMSYFFDTDVDFGTQGIVATFTGGGNITVLDNFGDTDTGTSVHSIGGSKFGDVINGSDEGEWAEGLEGADIYSMGGGTDTVSYEQDERGGGTSGVIVNMSGVSIKANVGHGLKTVAAGRALDGYGDLDRLSSVEEVHGTRKKDYIVGSSGDNQLQGQDGSDTLYGGGGNDNLRGDEGGRFNQGHDKLYGQAGDDSFKGGWGKDYVNGGSGKDEMQYGLETTFAGDDATHGVIVNLGAATLKGVSIPGISKHNVKGGTAIDTRGYVDTLVSIETIQATNYRDYLVGGKSADRFVGNSGNDVLIGNGGKDELNGDDGNDKLFGGTGDDNLYGHAGNDSLDGGIGNDYMEGGDGNDRLVGGKGYDTMVGGNGRDTFVFRTAAETSFYNKVTKEVDDRDRIETFNNAEDTIDLRGIDAIAGTKKNDSFTFLGETGYHQKAGELRYFFNTDSNKTVLEGDTTGDGRSDFKIDIVGFHTLDGSQIIG